MTNKERIELIENAKLGGTEGVIEIKNVKYSYGINLIQIGFKYRIIFNNLTCTNWNEYYLNSLDKLTKTEINSYIIKQLKSHDKYGKFSFYTFNELK